MNNICTLIEETKESIALYKYNTTLEPNILLNSKLEEISSYIFYSLTEKEKELLEQKLKQYEEQLIHYYLNSIKNCLTYSMNGISSTENAMNLFSISYNDRILDPTKDQYNDYLSYLITKQIKKYPEIYEFGITNLKIVTQPNKILGSYHTLVNENNTHFFYKERDSKVMTYTLHTKTDIRKVMH